MTMSERQALQILRSVHPGIKQAREKLDGDAEIAISKAVGEIRKAMRLINGAERKTDRE